MSYHSLLPYFPQAPIYWPTWIRERISRWLSCSLAAWTKNQTYSPVHHGNNSTCCRHTQVFYQCRKCYNLFIFSLQMEPKPFWKACFWLVSFSGSLLPCSVQSMSCWFVFTPHVFILFTVSHVFYDSDYFFWTAEYCMIVNIIRKRVKLKNTCKLIY